MNVQSDLTRHTAALETSAAGPSRQNSDLEAVMLKALAGLGWRRSADVLTAAMPRDSSVRTLDEAVMVLDLVDVGASVEAKIPAAWRSGLDGALVVQDKHGVHALVREDSRETVVSSSNLTPQKIAHRVGAAEKLLFIHNPEHPVAAVHAVSIRNRIKRGVGTALFLSLIINALALFIPFFSMTIFDRVLGAQASQSLVPLLTGAGVVLLAILVLRSFRSRLLAAEYARLGSTARLMSLSRILRLPHAIRQRLGFDRLQASFRPQTGATGTGGYGTFTVDAQGQWTYTADNTQAAIQALGAGSQPLTDTLTVTSIDGTTHDITVTIQGTNDAPVLSAATAAASEDGQAVKGQMAATDADTGDTKTFSIAQPVDGFTMNQDGTWSFDPSHAAYQHLAAGATQPVTIPVTVTDKAGATDTETLVITVTGTNDGPAVSGPVDLGSGTEDQSVQISAAQLLAHATDINTGDTLSVTSLTASHGTISGGAAHGFTFTPGPDYNGPVALSYQVTDGHGGTVAQTASLTLGATPDAAVITGTDTGSVIEDRGASATGDLQAGGTLTIADPDAGEAAFTAQSGVAGSGGYGTFSVDAQGHWTYSADNSQQAIQELGRGQSLTDTFQVSSIDGTTHTVSVEIKGLIDAPALTVTGSQGTDQATATAGTSATATLAALEDTVISLDIATALFDKDPTEHLGASLMIDGVPPGATLNHGSESHGHPGRWIVHLTDLPGLELTPPKEFSGPITLEVAQVATDFSAGEGSPIATSTATLHINVSPQNDMALIGGQDTGSVTEDRHLQAGQLHTGGVLTVTDVDTGDAAFTPLTSSAGAGTYGTFTLAADGTWTYSADNTQAAIQALGPGSQPLTDTLTVTSADGTQHSLTVTINGTNDAPTVTATSAAPADLGSLAEDTPKTFTEAQLLQLVGASDVDTGDTLHVTAATSAHGTFTQDATSGDWTFTPAAGFSGNDIAVTLTVNDGHADATAHGTLDITVVNDAANITGDSSATTTDDDTAVSGQLTVTDPDAGEAHFTAQTDVDGQYGQFSITSDGHWTFTPDDRADALNNGDTQQETFSVTSADGTRQNVVITVTGSDEGPASVGAGGGATIDVYEGSLPATDDNGDPITYKAQEVTGWYGTYHIDASGHFALVPASSVVQTLKDGDPVSDTLTVQDANGQDHGVFLSDVAVQPGKMDVPAGAGVGGSATVALFEGSMPSTDEYGNPITYQEQDVVGTYGTYHIDTSGHFVLSPEDWIIQSLDAGSISSDEFTVLDANGVTRYVGLFDVAVQNCAGGISPTDGGGGAAAGDIDAPTVSATSGHEANLGATDEDVSKTFTEAELIGLIGANDPQGDPLHISGVSIDPSAGSFAKGADGSWTFTPAANFKGTHLPVTVEVTDGTGSTQAHALMDVNPVADAPSLSISLGDAISVTGVGAPSLSTVVDRPGDGASYMGSVFNEFQGMYGQPALFAQSQEELQHLTAVIAGGETLTLSAPFHDDTYGWGVKVLNPNQAFIDHGGQVQLVFDDTAPAQMTWRMECLGGEPFVTGVTAWGEFQIDRATGTGAPSGPPVHFSADVSEDQIIPLQISLSDPDSSEQLTLSISGVPAGATLSAGTQNADGSWSLTPAQLTGLQLTPPLDFKGDIHLQVSATSTDGTDTHTSTIDLALTVAPAADTPTLSASDPSAVDEDAGTAIALDLQLGGHQDASETLTIQVEGVPDDATLSAGSKNADGSWSLDAADLSGLTVMPGAQYAGTMVLKVTATSTEATGEAASTATNVLVTVHPVIDTTFAVQDVTVAPSAAAGGIASPITLGNWGSDSSERMAVPADGSFNYAETGRAVALAGRSALLIEVPDNSAIGDFRQWQFSASIGHLQIMEWRHYDGTITHAIAVPPEELAHLTIRPPQGFTGDMQFHVMGSITDGTASATIDSTFTLSVDPNAPAAQADETRIDVADAETVNLVLDGDDTTADGMAASDHAAFDDQGVAASAADPAAISSSPSDGAPAPQGEDHPDLGFTAAYQGAPAAPAGDQRSEPVTDDAPPAPSPDPADDQAMDGTQTQTPADSDASRMASYFDAIGHNPAAAPAPSAQVSHLSSYLDAAGADPDAAVAAPDTPDPATLAVEDADGLENNGVQATPAPDPDLDPGPDLPDAIVQDPNDDTSQYG